MSNGFRSFVSFCLLFLFCSVVHAAVVSTPSVVQSHKAPQIQQRTTRPLSKCFLATNTTDAKSRALVANAIRNSAGCSCADAVKDQSGEILGVTKGSQPAVTWSCDAQGNFQPRQAMCCQSFVEFCVDKKGNQVSDFVTVNRMTKSSLVC
ncbi:hypothetical protein RvY_03856 [Ramazzottius varieornatus]|uniref:Thyroglobulin type-1 domain-containing protein n=1 Tax=Ramazzottius varieornatus TaxID=947166 RepID=A0A1D1UT43_RAMVA|nr:hypothetical protein RvY_03856 [Ramazzottius varieornatus]